MLDHRPPLTPSLASCPADTALSSSTYTVDFTQGQSSNWSVTAGSIAYSTSGAAFVINESGDAPTIETNFYVFFGRVSFFMRAASGTGIVSSAILLSDDLDEIDFEFLGGSADKVETDYFGKGNSTTSNREADLSIGDTQSTIRNYTVHWTSNATTWYVDGEAKRTLNYADALQGRNYPQTPMRVKLGIWAGGDSNNAEGTIEWAGGETDYSDGPFTMYVESVEIENFTPAASYSYGDMTGDWTSIEVEDETTNSNGNGDSATAATTTATAGADKASSTASGMWWTASASAVKAAASDASSLVPRHDVLGLSIVVVGIGLVMQCL